MEKPNQELQGRWSLKSPNHKSVESVERYFLFRKVVGGKSMMVQVESERADLIFCQGMSSHFPTQMVKWHISSASRTDKSAYISQSISHIIIILQFDK